jgi:CO/xanthine dehydrogenase Mo-binding subunit
MALSRRKVLKGLGWTAAGLVVVAGGAYAFAPRPALPYRGAPNAGDAAAWLRLTPEGVIEVVMPRAEIGQGIAIALRQIVAEETVFPLDRIRAVHPRTDLMPPARATVGSDSVKDFGPLLAKAAAALAIVLKREGSEGGAAPHGGWGAIASRSRLVEADAVEAAQALSFRPGPRRVVGQPHPTDAIRAIVTGSAPLYADDVRLPGMVFGAALRPPRLAATLASVDDTAARGLPGYLGLHRIGERAFLAAETRGGLERALAAVRTDWTGGVSGPPDVLAAVDIDEGLARGALEHVELDGRIRDGERIDLDLRLDVPMAAHACMEPRTAVAQLEGDALTVWTGTQDVTFVRTVLAKEVGLTLEKVTVIGCRVGGGFGGKTICTVEIEAALLARALGRPVKVQWTRADEFREAFHRPPSSHRIQARLTADGRIDLWRHAFRSGHVIFTSAAMGPVLQFATSFVGDPGVLRGAVPPYAAGTARVEFEDVRLPVHTGPWRGLGAAPNVWAIETAINELARRRGEDPFAFRKRVIAPQWPRLARALDRVAALSGWAGLRSTPERGYGIACGIYKEMAYAAVVAEVVREGGAFRVSRLWCAHDCGLMVNPDQVRAQVEGNLVWGVGMAMSEELTLADGHIAQASFGDYQVPRFSDVPEMMIDLVDEGEAPTGAGETAIVAATPAVTNAVAAMTGRPVTRLPFRPDRAA